MLSWYLCRWQLEIFFRILKSGRKIEDFQLEKVDCLEVSHPGFHAHRLARSGSHDGRPGMPPIALHLAVFDDDEWKAVYIVSKKQPPPDTPPTLKEIIRMIAGFGGFFNRAGDGLPGPQTIWIGLQRTKDFTLAIESQRSVFLAHAGWSDRALLVGMFRDGHQDLGSVDRGFDYFDRSCCDMSKPFNFKAWVGAVPMTTE